MTDIYILGGSALVVALMVAVAAMLGFRQASRIGRSELETLVAGAEPGARILDAIIASDGRAAIALLTDGRLSMARAMGDGVSLRTYPAHAVRFRYGKGKLRASFADLGFPTLTLALSDPPAWIATRTAEGGGEA